MGVHGTVLAGCVEHCRGNQLSNNQPAWFVVGLPVNVRAHWHPAWCGSDGYWVKGVPAGWISALLISYTCVSVCVRMCVCVHARSCTATCVLVYGPRGDSAKHALLCAHMYTPPPPSGAINHWLGCHEIQPRMHCSRPRPNGHWLLVAHTRRL